MRGFAGGFPPLEGLSEADRGEFSMKVLKE